MPSGLTSTSAGSTGCVSTSATSLGNGRSPRPWKERDQSISVSGARGLGREWTRLRAALMLTGVAAGGGDRVAEAGEEAGEVVLLAVVVLVVVVVAVVVEGFEDVAGRAEGRDVDEDGCCCWFAWRMVEVEICLGPERRTDGALKIGRMAERYAIPTLLCSWRGRRYDVSSMAGRFKEGAAKYFLVDAKDFIQLELGPPRPSTPSQWGMSHCTIHRVSADR